MIVDTAKINRLKDKFQKYPPYAIKQGLKASADYMNTPSFKASMYPPSQSGSTFVWSNDRQRRYVFANVKLPSIRTMELANAGQFTIDERYFTVGYQNLLSWAKFVIHPSFQIIGHRLRGWEPVNGFVIRSSGKIVPIFKTAVINAWKDMDSFIFGGGAGL